LAVALAPSAGVAQLVATGARDGGGATLPATQCAAKTTAHANTRARRASARHRLRAARPTVPATPPSARSVTAGVGWQVSSSSQQG